MARKMSKAEAGRLGGKATVAKYGNEYMTDIASRGGTKTTLLYSIMPIGVAQYAMVSRATNKVKAVF